jgi:hypothetical protein
MYYIATKNDTDYLIHHGVKGQKWGVRRYQKKLNSADKKAMKYTKKHDYIDKRLALMRDKRELKGANNVSVGFDKRFDKLVNSHEKYSVAVKKIDRDIKKTVTKILDKGYNVSATSVHKYYKNPGGLSKSPVWGHKYTISKSDSRPGSLTVDWTNSNLGHQLHNESADRARRYSKMLGVPMSSLKRA